MRGMLEDENEIRKKNQLKELQEYNQRLAEEKRQRERVWRENNEVANQQEIKRTNMTDIMTENFQTTVSQLAPHRYVPYHFKGLRPDQIEGIFNEREGQIDAKKQAIKNANSEEFQWAVQNLANTQHLLNNELELEQKKQDLAAVHRDHALVDKDAKDARWPNMYGDLNPIPNVERNMDAAAAVRPVQ